MRSQALCSLLIGALLISASAFATEISEQLRVDLIEAGVSPRAISLVNEKMSQSQYSKGVVGIVDYTLPSTTRRFFVMDLQLGTFRAYRVSHGVRSGGLMAMYFSNLNDSRHSSLGFIRTGLERHGAFGRSLTLIGLSPSNSNLSKRAIILHSAEYSSDEFQAANGFFGRSYGCLAVNQVWVDEIIDQLGTGALILAYHDMLWDEAQVHPMEQTLGDRSEVPPPTEWEEFENEHGDPEPHVKGMLPSSHFKKSWGYAAP